MVDYEAPNPFLYKFTGTLFYDNESIPLSNDNFVLRGSSLKNTDYIIGLVCYTGHHTKIMLNSAKSKAK